MTLQIRRGNDSDRLTITPAIGELIFTTDTKELFVGDGSTVGGNHVATDSSIVTSIIDSAYVQLKNKGFAYANLTGTPTIPTFGTNFVDSAEVIRLIGNEALDSDLTVQLVDSAYIQLRDRFQDSSLVTSTVDAAYVQARQIQYNTSNFADSAFVTAQVATVDSAYVQLRALDGDKSLNGLKALQFIHDSDAATYTVTVASKDASHRYQGTGSGLGYKIDGTFSPTIVMNPGNTYRFDMSDGTTSTHPLYFYYDAAKTTQYTTNVLNNYSSKSAGSAGSYIEITVTDDTPSVLHYQCGSHGYMGGMINTQTRNLTGFTTDNLGEGSSNLYYTNTRVSTLVDAAYVQSRQVKYTTADFPDSAGVTTLIQANSIDSAAAIALIDSTYVQARQSGGEITIQEEGSSLSTAATTLNFVGSNVTASGTGTTKTITITGGGAGGTDSATVSAIILADVDSDYVSARQSGTVNITDAITQTVFYFTADSGQTTFTGADDAGGTLAYTTNKVAVYINGLYQQNTTDYAATNGTSVVLTEAADSGDIIAIETLKGSNLTSQPIFRDVFHYTATAGQTTFSGADDFSKTLTYKPGRAQAYLNGIMLIETTDFTATTGTTVILTTGADSGDIVSIEKLDGTGMGIDSSAALALISPAYIQANQKLLDSGLALQLLLDSSEIVALIDSSYVQARQTASGVTVQEEGVSLSNAGTTLNFVGASVTAAGTGATKTITIAGGGTDSAATIALIEDELAVFSVGDLVGADGNPGDMLVSDGDGTASWTGNGALSVEFKVNYDSLGVISSVSDLPTGFTADSTGTTTVIISHNTGRSVKDITYNSYVSGTLKLRRPSADSADIVTYAVADRLNKFTANVSQATTGADADQYAWVNITF